MISYEICNIHEIRRSVKLEFDGEIKISHSWFTWKRLIRKSEKERQNVFFCLTVAAFVHIFNTENRPSHSWGNEEKTR